MHPFTQFSHPNIERGRSHAFASILTIAALITLLVTPVTPAQPNLTITTTGGPIDATYVRVEGTQTGIRRPMWYEVHADSADGKITDFGAFANADNWFFYARRLGKGDNVVIVFGSAPNGRIVHRSITFTISPSDTSKVNPRPRPAEIWWGGLGENQQLMDPDRPWDFVKRHADAYFFHSAYWNDQRIETIAASIRKQLAPYATKFAVEMGGQQGTIYDEESARRQFRAWGAPGRLGTFYDSGGIFFSEVTHDYSIDFEPAACHYLTNIDPDATEKDVLRYAIHHLWGDLYFKPNYEAFPCIKAAQTTSEAWRWVYDYPPCFFDEFDFSTTTKHTDGIYCPLMRDRDAGEKLLIDGHEVNMRFSLDMVLPEFISMCRAIPGHNTFSFYSDFPYIHMTLHGEHSPYAIRARAKIRAVEDLLHSRGAFHTFVCNDGVPPKMPDPEAGHRNWCQAALKSMQLHQREGGRADRYLFESWYSTHITENGTQKRTYFPFWVAPETKKWSYTWLARRAIKYVKGIKDVGGTLEQLELTTASIGAATSVTIRNNGDIPCMPAIVAREDGDQRILCTWRDQWGADIGDDIRTEEGWVYTPMLAPDETVTISCLAQIPDGAASKRIVVEAFWNPQDPTGIVRDRAIWTVGNEQ